MGFDYATFCDHVLMPKECAAQYPYTDSGEFPAGSLRRSGSSSSPPWPSSPGKTSRLRLRPSVMVVPHRPAVLTAKILATID